MAAVFATTHWSVVLTAGQPDAPHAAQALETLCRAYWYPLYAFGRRLGHAPADAQDLTQGFFEHLLETQLVAKADARHGKFRSFLLASFKNFMSVERARAQTQKRGGGHALISLNAQSAEERFVQEPSEPTTPESIYERNWALTVIDQALTLMEAEFASKGRHQLFVQLRPFLQGDKSALTYADAARNLGTTEGTIKVTVNRMRQRYRELLRSAVAHTVANPAAVEEELRHLLTVLRG